MNDAQNVPSKFGILQLMLTTVLAALLCAFLTRLIRMLAPEEQFTGIAFVLAILIGMLAYITGSVIFRSRIEKRAGARQFFSSGSRVSFHHLLGCFWCTLWMACMALLLWSRSRTETSTLLSVWPDLLQISVFGSFSLNYLLNTFIWKVSPGSIDVRENGLIIGGWQLFPWNSLTGYRWNKFSKKLTLFREGGFVECNVPEQHKAALAKEIERFIPFKKR